MIDIPIEKIIEKIKTEKSLSESEIREKIKEKCDQLGGLVSEQGAATIIANELGVQLFKIGGNVKIADLYTNAKNIEVVGKVLQKYELKDFSRKDGGEGKIASFLLGDETGIVRIVLWNDQTSIFDKIEEGSIILIKNPMVKENNGKIELQLNKFSSLEINPEGISINVPSTRRESKAKYIKDLSENEEDVELLATIIQVFDPRFFEICPQCRKRLNEGMCDVHGMVEPETNALLSLILDDGTGTLRSTFWKKQADILLKEDILKYKETGFEEKKTDLLGEIVKVIGDVKRNESFDRLEFTPKFVYTQLDPEKEIERFNERKI